MAFRTFTYNAICVALILALSLPSVAMAQDDSVSSEPSQESFQVASVPERSTLNRGKLRRLINKGQSILDALSEDSVPLPIDESELSSLPEGEEEAYKEKLEEWMSEDSEPFDIVLTLMRKGKQVSSALIGIQKGLTVYVPVQEIARQVDFNVDLDLENGTVTGFSGTQENTYIINTQNKTLTLGNTVIPIDDKDFIVQDFSQGLGDIYVTTDILNKMWGLRLEVDYSRMALNINTPRLLPVEREKQRRDRQNNFLVSQDSQGEEGPTNYEHIPNPYKLFGKPAVNINSQIRYDSVQSEVSTNTSLHGAGEMLGTHADFNIRSRYDDDGYDLRNARLRVSRDAHHGSELPLGIKSFEGGDISVRPPELVDRFVNGAGISISNEPFDRRKSFDTITVEGTGQPGWEVEVYNGLQLVDFGTIDNDGVYRFENVELTYGDNEVRTVLYGPQGQVEEIVKDYNILNTMLPRGEVRYELSALQNNEKLIDLDNTNDRITDGYLHTAKVQTGLNAHMSPFVTHTTMNTQEGRKNYTSLGTDFAAFDGVGRIEAYKELGGGSALDLQYNRKFAGVRVKGQSSFFTDDYRSSESNFGNRAKVQEHSLNANTNVKLGPGGLGIRLGGNQTRFINGDKTSNLITALGYGYRNLRFNNQTNTRYEGSEHRNTSGRLATGYNMSDNWNFRGALGYDVYPDTELRTGQFEVRYTDRDKFTSSFSANHNLANNSTVLGANASYDFDHVLAGIGLDWNVGEGFDALVSTTMSLGPFGEDGGYTIDSGSQLSKSSFEARLYRDVDGDGQFTEVDTPVENIELRLNGRKTDPTDENGEIKLSKAPRGLVRVSVDEDGLSDQLLIPSEDAYTTVIRPLSAVSIDIPLVTRGSIDGFVYFENGKPSPTMRVQLVDGKGRIVGETSTDFTGYYLFERVRPGTYVVRADPEYDFIVPPMQIAVSSDNPFQQGINLQVAGLLEKETKGNLKSRLKNIISIFEKRQTTL